jgi:niacin transporter
MSFPKALFLVALPIHAILEGLIVIPFGIPFEGALVNVVGTAIHHSIDAMISIIVMKAALPLIKTIKRTRGNS